MYSNPCSTTKQLGCLFFFYRTVQFDSLGFFGALLPAAAVDALLGLGQIIVVPLSFSLTLKMWAPQSALNH